MALRVSVLLLADPVARETHYVDLDASIPYWGIRRRLPVYRLRMSFATPPQVDTSFRLYTTLGIVIGLISGLVLCHLL